MAQPSRNMMKCAEMQFSQNPRKSKAQMEINWLKNLNWTYQIWNLILCKEAGVLLEDENSLDMNKSQVKF